MDSYNEGGNGNNEDAYIMILSIEFWAIVRGIIVWVLLWAIANDPTWWWLVLSLPCFCEMFYVVVGLHLEKKESQWSVARSLFGLAEHYLETTAFFAGCYLMLQHSTQCVAFNEQLCAWTAFYFSFATITTLGYGDIRPISAWAQILVVVEILIGFFIIVVAVARVLDGGSVSKRMS